MAKKIRPSRGHCDIIPTLFATSKAGTKKREKRSQMQRDNNGLLLLLLLFSFCYS
jgi:hypothetical protein